MTDRITVAAGERRYPLAELELPLDLNRLVTVAGAGGDPRWELEIGFGKGRYLLERAGKEPETAFLGVEMAGRYQRLAARRAQRRGLENLLLVHGEAIYLLSAVLPARFARAVHVYFPDPWPKGRHHKRRFLAAENLDLVLRALEPAGTLFFATDHPEFGREARSVLESHPALDVVRRRSWPEGPRTNYEAKYDREGRSILRLEARLRAGAASLDLGHPEAGTAVLVAPRCGGSASAADTSVSSAGSQ